MNICGTKVRISLQLNAHNVSQNFSNLLKLTAIYNIYSRRKRDRKRHQLSNVLLYISAYYNCLLQILEIKLHEMQKQCLKTIGNKELIAWLVIT